MMGIAGESGAIPLLRQHGSLVTSSNVAAPTTETESHNDSTGVGQAAATCPPIQVTSVAMIFQASFTGGSGSLHFTSGAWPVVGDSWFTALGVRAPLAFNLNGFNLYPSPSYNIRAASADDWAPVLTAAPTLPISPEVMHG